MPITLDEDRRDTAWTLGLVLAIPVFLTLLYYLLPEAIHNAFVFDHSRFSVYTLWTSAYIHRNFSHLTSNLLGYAIAILPLLLIYSRCEGLERFRNLLLVFLVGVPPLVSISDYLIFRFVLGVAEESATRGFSGVVAALYGLLFATLVGYVYELRDWIAAVNFGLAIVLATLGGVLFYSGVGSLLLYGVVAGGVAIVGVNLVSLNVICDGGRLKDAIKKWGHDGILVAYGGLVIVLIVPMMFPINWVGQESVTNIFGHAAGFLLGCLLAIFR